MNPNHDAKGLFATGEGVPLRPVAAGHHGSSVDEALAARGFSVYTGRLHLIEERGNIYPGLYRGTGREAENVGSLSISNQHSRRVEEQSQAKKMKERYPEIKGVLVVEGSNVDSSVRGQGLGRLFYEKMLVEAGKQGYALTSAATSGGVTVPDSRRVWDSLSKDYPHEGDVVYAPRGHVVVRRK